MMSLAIHKRSSSLLLSSFLVLGGCSSSKSPGTPTGSGGITGAGTGGVSLGAGGASAGGSGGVTAGLGGAAAGTGGGAGVATGGAPGANGAAGAAANTGGAVGSGGALGAGAGGSVGGGGGGGGVVGVGGAGGGGVAVACQAPIPVTTGTPATITVNIAGAAVATVGPDLMGIHSSVYDGSIGLPSTIDLLRAVGVTSMRYPGGSIGDVYHFETNLPSLVTTINSATGDVYIAPGADFGSFVSVLARVGANALITVNYGTNPGTNGPGLPQEAAAWVAYANALPTSTVVIGMDTSPTPRDWMTAGYWATLRAAAPLAVDDGMNFLRINHPAPVGIKYWEIGNEVYGNGFFGGVGIGWEADLHVLPMATRLGAAALSPATYGRGVTAFAAAMKAVDPTIKIGGIVSWPDTRWTNFNRDALAQGCASMDFVVDHYYAGTTIASLLTAPGTDIPAMFRDLRTLLTANCPAGVGAAMPIGITEWSPNPNDAGPIQNAYAAMPMTNTQTFGIFAANAYANFMEQGALVLHWHELHGVSYIPNVMGVDMPTFGYHGAQMAHALAAAGDSLLPQPTVANATTLMSLLINHASRHTDGSVSVMMTNTSPTVAANVTLNVTGGALDCVGTKYTYAPMTLGADLDGSVTTSNIFASTTGASLPVAVPPYSVVVVRFPSR